ncbi:MULTISPECIES: alpha/beta fold hydrolase [Marivita]|uniref:Alpha/beta hydrolase n=1 Tax=Marivita cryptomonadis TaxID=505252 RepID=A0ABS1ZXS1_9RHOB|nr:MULTISPECIES: alpha/beta hydrolase [Marivita]MBM2332414.1 alpha/beta hydrolase [Marivita cryptomonadis]MBM2341998.1 alpha/beta hydrolase [Marivita cryptomonadis]MBM2346662.1 alpha/beta hydrolase [Marivita cryptomonadis]MBM2365851.1 alpha/beta hydrolase [Marivita cryptomonadis]MBM2375193.1 alpha/beta hydrolase [Marivita cryptomonadis]
MAIEGLSNKPWLLLPGTLCTGAVFDRFLDGLGVAHTARTFVTLDRPSIEDYRVDFDGLATDTIVCGFSLGAIVAAHFADSMTADRLILFGLNPYADDPAKAPLRHALLQDVRTFGGAAALKTRLADIFGPAPDATRAAICQMAEETAPLIGAQTQLALSRPGALPALTQAAMPVLAATGTQDQASPPPQGQAAAQNAPNGQFRRLDGLGHFAPLEDPSACAKVMRDW